MKPVFQTRYGQRKSDNTTGGNCFQAAIASLFELELNDVPDFCNIYPFKGDEWWLAYIEWLNQKGFSVISIDLRRSGVSLSDREYKDCIILVHGPNINGIQHCVLYKNGHPIHDPNKNCSGGITPEFAGIIFPLNPMETK